MRRYVLLEQQCFERTIDKRDLGSHHVTLSTSTVELPQLRDTRALVPANFGSPRTQAQLNSRCATGEKPDLEARF